MFYCPTNTALTRLFPNFGFQIITEPSSLEDLPCHGTDKLSNSEASISIPFENARKIRECARGENHFAFLLFFRRNLPTRAAARKIPSAVSSKDARRKFSTRAGTAANLPRPASACRPFFCRADKPDRRTPENRDARDGCGFDSCARSAAALRAASCRRNFFAAREIPCARPGRFKIHRARTELARFGADGRVATEIFFRGVPCTRTR
jgi:hypothetical protein